MHLRRNITLLTLFAIAVITIWTSSNINWGKERWTRIIKSDGNGYYAYLPAVFIYKDLHFGFFEEIAAREGYGNMAYEYRYTYQGKVVNKYFAGTALAQLPFFLSAHFYCWLTGQSINGYSKPYLIAINIASLFYLLLACFFLNKILLHYRISSTNKVIVLFATVFGTNLFYYAVYEPSMSHIYSLGFMTMFIYTLLRYFKNFRIKYLLFSAILLGMITFIRPVNLLILVAIPFLAGSWDVLKRSLLHIGQNRISSIIAIILFILPLLIQLLIYKMQTGHFWVYSYGQERFHFNQPHMVDMLFSYRKGLFIYSPLLLLSLAGLFFVYKERKSTAINWLVFFLLLTYILSCWHQWYYGGSFGSRVYIEFYALFAILLGILLENIKNKVSRSVVIAVLGVLVLYSVIQTYQYYAGIIHWSEMTRERYWEVFLKFG